MSHNSDKCDVPGGVIYLFCLISCLAEKSPSKKSSDALKTEVTATTKQIYIYILPENILLLLSYHNYLLYLIIYAQIAGAYSIARYL